MKNPNAHPGMAAMEAAAARDLEVNAVARAEDAETTRRQEAFSDRLPAENSLAEYELFGSGNSTIRNPETGEVMADPSNPKVGLLEQMRTDRRYGKTEDDRNAYADAYEARLEGLTKDEGLELAQAKLILDLEEGDVQKRGKLIGAEITNGKTAQEAEAHVDAQLARLGQKRKELILDGGALTKEDYDTLRTGGELYPVEAEEATASEAPSVSASPEAEAAPEIDHAAAAAEAARRAATEADAASNETTPTTSEQEPTPETEQAAPSRPTAGEARDAARENGTLETFESDDTETEPVAQTSDVDNERSSDTGAVETKPNSKMRNAFKKLRGFWNKLVAIKNEAPERLSVAQKEEQTDSKSSNGLFGWLNKRRPYRGKHTRQNVETASKAEKTETAENSQDS